MDNKEVQFYLGLDSYIDNKENFIKLLNAFDVVEEDYKINFPIHPCSRKMISEFGLDQQINAMKNLMLLKPLGYLDFMNLLHDAKFVLTDSGGIQEVTIYLGIPCLTMRENTERPITVDIGTNKMVGSNTEIIVSEAKKILSGQNKKGRIPPLWDGKAAERIVEVIKNV